MYYDQRSRGSNYNNVVENSTRVMLRIKTIFCVRAIAKPEGVAMVGSELRSLQAEGCGCPNNSARVRGAQEDVP
ncbi:MAG: hypothetical protein ACXW5U_24975 [Thermoanaerobaculia bacterium]